MTRMVIHVDRLVLHGVPSAQRDALVHALRLELQRQLAEPGAAQRWAQLGARPRLQLAPLPAAPEPGAELGGAVARHLAGSVR